MPLADLNNQLPPGAQSAIPGMPSNIPSAPIMGNTGLGLSALSGNASSGSLDSIIKAAAPYGQGAIQKAVSAFNSGQMYNPATGQTSPMSAGGNVPVAGMSDAWMGANELAASGGDRLGGGAYARLGSGGGGGGGEGSPDSGGGSGSSAGASAGGLFDTSGGGGSGSGASAGSLSSYGYPTGNSLGSIGQGSSGSTFPVNGGGTIPSVNAGSTVSGQMGPVQMQQANPQSAFNQYQGSLGYQLLGNDQTNQYQQSPGYQYAVNEAMRQVQGNAASRGLLESGSALRAMTDRAQGMAQQDYGNWWNRQNQLYGDYQNRLAGLAGGSTGAAEANQLGQNLAAGTYQTGSNVGSLFGNQGSSGMGGIINTGAAQSNNMTNAGVQQAQVDSANQATRLSGATLGQF